MSRTLTAAGGVAFAEVVASDPVPSPSFNGPVYAVAYRGDTVYVGGNFTAAIVNGKQSPGSGWPRSTPVPARCSTWAPAADANVRALAVDGDVVYAAGDFDTDLRDRPRRRRRPRRHHRRADLAQAHRARASRTPSRPATASSTSAAR